ncbi:MAG: ISAs1 family transposase [Gammaproteobacteria bacterium]
MDPAPDPNSLDRHRFDTLVVRPVEASERIRWDEEMRAHHYLGFRAMPGESIRYVALLDGEWVALLGWGSAAWSNGYRDRMIGWTTPQRARRLCYLANNMRYLILPGVRRPHLASKVLALCLRRLSSDWEERYGHPILLVETFIDPARFSGTCYRAAGFRDLGETKGYRRNAGRYDYHGEVKRIFVRPLRKEALRLLSSPDHLPIFHTQEARVPIQALSKKDIQSLMDDLARMTDPRKRRGIRHSQISLIATLVCALLSGACHTRAMAEWAAHLSDALKKRLGFRKHPKTQVWVAPSEPTLRRALQSIDAREVEQAISGWLQRILSQSGLTDAVPVLSVDGKTVRGASKAEGGQKIHLLSAFLHNRGIVVAQKNVDEKTNEIPELRALLAPMEIAGQIVTADALHTQTETARFITEDKKADQGYPFNRSWA